LEKSRLTADKLQGFIDRRDCNACWFSSWCSGWGFFRNRERDVIRQYVALKPSSQFRAVYREASRSRQLKAVQEHMVRLLDELGAPPRVLQENAFTVASTPSLDWTADLAGDAPDAPILEDVLEELIVALEFGGSASLGDFREVVLANLGKSAGHGDAFVWIGADPGGDLADHWCPGSGNLATFGRRTDARRVLNVGMLDAELPPADRASTPRVNVVIFDQGLNKEAILASHPSGWGGGWGQAGIASGTAERSSHGRLIARNVLDIAPDAVVYDVPLIPKPAIADIPIFASGANAAYQVVLLWIKLLRTLPRWSGPWMLVNAWAIYDRASEMPLGDYTENKNDADPHSIGHRLNNIIAEAALRQQIDVVFAAGNCGAFCPAQRCGKLDRGAGSSIWGGNSSSAVITTGAVLTNDMWLGYSSQGPGQERLGYEKPDFCAPSQFSETTDAHMLNTGTSTACGLTAGVVAALRRGWDPLNVSPQALKHVLTDTARKIQGPAWNGRIGYGVLNAGAAFERLSTSNPLALQRPGALVRASSGSTQEASCAPRASRLGRIFSRLAGLVKSLVRN
jgi:hypothetical protein